MIFGYLPEDTHTQAPLFEGGREALLPRGVA